MKAAPSMRAQTEGQRIPSFPDRESNGGFALEKVMKRLEHIVAPHVDSFDYFLEEGIHTAINDIPPMMISLRPRKQGARGSENDEEEEVEEDETDNVDITIHFEDIVIEQPSKRNETIGLSVGKEDVNLTPREARERGISYTGALWITACIVVDGNDEIRHRMRLGDLPIMVMSSKCPMKGLSQKQLVQKREEANEKGGYFILNGIERVIRLLQVPRRNHPMAIERNSYKNRGPAYSNKGVQMRCVRPDQSSITITLHYLNNGGTTMKFTLRKQEFLLPAIVVAKSLMDITDRELFERLLQGDRENTFLSTRLEVLLRDAKQHGIYSAQQGRAWLGSLFRMYLPVSDVQTDEEAGLLLIQRFFFIHAESLEDKLECLLLMMRKLFSFAEGNCAEDNADAMANHELLLPGHLFNMILKEKLEEVLVSAKQTIQREYNISRTRCVSDVRTQPLKFCQRHLQRTAVSCGGKLATFLSTGNVTSSTGLDLMQVSGYTIVAERLNIYRYMSHFQSVHRGQFFTTMKTTAVRKLLPESWGFLCPVHTPDGSPCGLLNHLARESAIVCFPTESRMPTTGTGAIEMPGKKFRGDGENKSDSQGDMAKGDVFINKLGLQRLLVDLGMVPQGLSSGGGQGLSTDAKSYIPVCIDGLVVGDLYVGDYSTARSGDDTQAIKFVKHLRLLKATGGLGKASQCMDPTTELAFFPPAAIESQSNTAAYPGLYIQTQPGRMVRPVAHLGSGLVEWIGPMEQQHLEIACLSSDIRTKDSGSEYPTTHQELDPTQMLSHIASLTPFSDYNQSPRNMYQCQMGKQTMGTPAHAMKHRSDNKLYRIQNSQAPLVQTKSHREYGMDEYPNGCNAIVAVVAFTGFDMEDAMIINKGAFQRGFGHGCMYKTQVIDLDDEEKRANKGGDRPALLFSNIKAPPVPRPASESEGSQENEEAEEGMAGEKYCEELDIDGLPEEGEEVAYGQPLCCLVDTISGEFRIIRHKETEKAFVDTVRVLGRTGSSPGPGSRKVSITLRYPRQPVIGDKFSSRHGQKGTLSVLWPQEDMPFTESGMTPDIMINPHAFPSRMTIGMLIESMAGKAGAMHGHFQDATPFQFHEQDRVVDHVGHQLKEAGYNYHGSEPLYNGLTGQVMHVDIFIGVVYYQRLRHMVSDKSQVRSTGPVQAVTRQPVKGRKKHGGIRLGEMERDALLSHGVAFCLQDRLMNCSDAHMAHVCATCGGFLSVRAQGINSFTKNNEGSGSFGKNSRQQMCSACNSADGVRPIRLPYVYRYLANELAAMGVKLKLQLS